MLKSLWGRKKSGVKLHSISKEDPYLFAMTDGLYAHTLEPYESVLFVPDGAGEVNRLYYGLSEFKKKGGIHSLRVKLKIGIGILTILSIVIVLLIILKVIK
ncbi:MAG: hypothetical protein GF364_15975 [Candidatus Lokiarchaeota archaeon]|nr:hypothetical protein [Candidatus Lokiarchaeota archaeon]